MIASFHAEVQRINNLFKLAKTLPQEEEVLSHWACYLCILVAGLIENTIGLLLSEYARTHASSEAANFIANQMRYQSNLNASKIRQLLGSFSDQWASDFDSTLLDDQKEAIDSILSNRHNIAHGRSNSISLVRVKDYYSRIQQVLEWISRRISTS
jgi:hypothetical protein